MKICITNFFFNEITLNAVCAAIKCTAEQWFSSKLKKAGLILEGMRFWLLKLQVVSVKPIVKK